ncbi:UbiD family decarboxylase [Granulicella cerasi]|uniref:UbiD family decarboxylase n=1 Tax=Granulicella cerasi TaxID=741063 RepID=A0ABW1Z8P5_9BACT|nr:UbiD family decarboxylase [Granulicella cerasi]
MSSSQKDTTLDHGYDLRAALRFLSQHPGQLRRSAEPVDPNAELAGVYRHVGAGTPVLPPTTIGPAMLFEKVKGFDDFRVVTGVMASRERVALLLDTPKEKLGDRFRQAVDNPIPPIKIDGPALCQQVVVTKDIDVRKLVPAPTNTPDDAGPFFTMGLVRATDPETGKHDVTIHRMCIQGKDEISIFFAPGRHIDAFRQKAEAQGKSLPISVSIGLDPAVYIGACFEAPTTPLGFDELSIAGSIRQRPVELVKCVTQNEYAIANAEVVIEGELLPNVRVVEDQNSKTGHAMPEFPGYNGPANPSLPLIKVTAITHREKPILQTIVGPGEEHVNLAGPPTEASIYRLVEQAMPGRLQNVYAHTAGGGKFLAILQFKKLTAGDEGRQRQAALTAFAAYSELKNVILVDDDVDIFNTNDVLWAMQTRYQGDIDTIFIPDVICHPLDPSQDPEYSRTISKHGNSCKTIFDCTAPWKMKEAFTRAQFVDVDLKKFLVEPTTPLEL